MRYLRFVLPILIALLPSVVKVPIYRWFFRYRIGKKVRIGFTPFIGVKRCRIGDHTRIGSLNCFYRIQDLDIGERTQIGFLNLFRGGRRIRIGDYCTILRQNVFNAILEADTVTPVDSLLDLGTGVFIASAHWLDFTDGIVIGEHTVVGGRNSTFWTHNRQRSRSIRVGCHCYLGSGLQAAPGLELPSFCIVCLGSVLTGRFEEPRSLIGGNPGRVLRPLQSDDLFFVVRKTRNDIPDEVVAASLPPDLINRVRQPLNGNPVPDEKLVV